jgi:hypothetical protein
MALLGKILIVLNVLAAAVFAWLGAADYAQRRNWAQDGFRHELAVNGLPVDKTELDPLSNRPEVDRLDKNTLEQVFQGVGQPVQTQLEEVDAVHDRLKRKLSGLPDSGRRQLLAATIVPLAHTGPQREALTARIRDDKMEALLGPDGLFERTFKAAKLSQDIAGADPADPNQSRILDPFEWAFQDPGEKVRQGAPREREPEAIRRTIAHLLFNLPPEEESPQRVVAVTGLKAYAEEGDRQAYALGDVGSGAAARMKQIRDSDRAAFVGRHIELIKELQVLDQRLQESQAELARVKDVQAKNQALFQARQTDVANLQARLKQARAQTNAALAALADEQKLLFDAQRVVGQAQQANERLEHDLRKSEHLGP